MNDINSKTTHYILTESYITVDGHTVTTYGIKGGSVSFPDTTTDRLKAENMIVRLNTEELEESQLMYFIEDELDR